MYSPQSPPHTRTNVYPSPRSKSPRIRKATSSRYPLSDITNFSLAQAALEVVPSRSFLGRAEGQDVPSCDSLVPRSPIPPSRPLISEPPYYPSALPPYGSIGHHATSPKLCSPPPSPALRVRKIPKRNSNSWVPLNSTDADNSPGLLPQFVIDRKKRTKRELAELQWQFTVYCSLVRHLESRRRDQKRYNFDVRGLMIKLDEQPQWTDELDRQLVGKFLEKLLMQGCRPLNATPLVSPLVAPLPHFPMQSPEQIPFPTLGPPIQLEIQNKAQPPIPRRMRVSALLSSPASACRSLQFSPSSPLPAQTPEGTLSPRQLVAQIMLRRSQARAQPIRRSVIAQRVSGANPV